MKKFQHFRFHALETSQYVTNRKPEIQSGTVELERGGHSQDSEGLKKVWKKSQEDSQRRDPSHRMDRFAIDVAIREQNNKITL